MVLTRITLRHLLQSNGADRKTMKVMISGAPATGKGTQCLRILDKVRLLALLYAVGHISYKTTALCAVIIFVHVM